MRDRDRDRETERQVERERQRETERVRQTDRVRQKHKENVGVHVKKYNYRCIIIVMSPYM